MAKFSVEKLISIAKEYDQRVAQLSFEQTTLANMERLHGPKFDLRERMKLSRRKKELAFTSQYLASYYTLYREVIEAGRTIILAMAPDK